MRISDWSSDVCSSDLGVSASDVEIVDPPVDSIDYHIMPVAMFVGQAAMDQPPDQGFAQVGRHDTFDPRAVQTARGQLALHEADDVAAFAHPPQRILQPFDDPVAPAPAVLGPLPLLPLAHAPGRHRLPDGSGGGQGP